MVAGFCGDHFGSRESGRFGYHQCEGYLVSVEFASHTDEPMTVKRITAKWFIVAWTAVVMVTTVFVPASAADSVTSLESCFLSKINASRAGVGAPALSHYSGLVSFTRSHSVAMADAGQPYHSPWGAFDSLLPAGWNDWGENVGMGPSGSGCGELHDAFMASPGHRASLMNPKHSLATIGVFIDDELMIWTTHIFISVDEISTAADPEVTADPVANAEVETTSVLGTTTDPDATTEVKATSVLGITTVLETTTSSTKERFVRWDPSTQGFFDLRSSATGFWLAPLVETDEGWVRYLVPAWPNRWGRFRCLIN